MRILDVLREQEDGEEPKDVLRPTDGEEPMDVDSSDEFTNSNDILQELKTKLDSLKHSISSYANDRYGNEIRTAIFDLKFDYGVLEISLDIAYTIRGFENIPQDGAPNDFIVIGVKSFLKKLDNGLKLGLYGESVLSNIAFNFYQITKFVRREGSYVGSSVFDMLYMDPVKEKYRELHTYTELINEDKLEQLYTYPEEYTIKYEEGFKEYYTNMFNKSNKIYDVLKEGRFDGHTYEIRGSSSMLIHFRYTKMDEPSPNGIIIKKSDIYPGINIISFNLKIDGKPATEVEDEDYELYRQCRLFIQKSFAHFKIRESFYDHKI
jgi:hypothetical protein